MTNPSIEVAGAGFRIGATDVSWSDIESIRVFKLDLLTWDEIRFSLQVPGGLLEVSEEQEGFAAFAAELERRFPATVGWRARVTKPAFARNETVLWVRS